MQIHMLADTVRPILGTTAFEDSVTTVLPRASVFRPVSPSKEALRDACKEDVLNLVFTAPAQLSGTYAAARETFAKDQNCAVLDSRTFAAGQLLLMQKAFEMAQNEKFSVHLLRNLRRTSRKLCCYFVAPNGSALRLSGVKKPILSIPFRFTVFRIGSEGEIHRHANVYAATPQQALYRCVYPHLKKGMCTAIADDRAGEAAEALSNLLTRRQASVLRGECIPTDLPFGPGGFLSVAFLKEEVSR